MLHFPWILRAQGVAETAVEDDDRSGPSAAEEEAGRADDAPHPTKIVSGVVATVNLREETCTLTDGSVVRLGGRVAQVAEALSAGGRVRIDAEGILTDRGLIAGEVWIRAEERADVFLRPPAPSSG